VSTSRIIVFAPCLTAESILLITNSDRAGPISPLTGIINTLFPADIAGHNKLIDENSSINTTIIVNFLKFLR
jgi:hypothetical protein